MKKIIECNWATEYNGEETIWSPDFEMNNDGHFILNDWLENSDKIFQISDTEYHVVENYFTGDLAHRIVLAEGDVSIDFTKLVYSQINSNTTKEGAFNVLEILKEHASDVEYHYVKKSLIELFNKKELKK